MAVVYLDSGHRVFVQWKINVLHIVGLDAGRHTDAYLRVPSIRCRRRQAGSHRTDDEHRTVCEIFRLRFIYPSPRTPAR